MKFTIEDEHGKCELETKSKHLDIHETIDVIERLLIAQSFSPETVRDGILEKASEIKQSYGG